MLQQQPHTQLSRGIPIICIKRKEGDIKRNNIEKKNWEEGKKRGKERIGVMELSMPIDLFN